MEYINTNFLKNHTISYDEIKDLTTDDLNEFLYNLLIKDYEKKMLDTPLMNEFEKAISLRVIDSNWVDHMSAMEHLKEGIGLRGYGQMNPIQAYTTEGFHVFDELLDRIDNNIAVFLLKSEVKQNIERKQTLTGTARDGKEEVKQVPHHNTTKKI